MGLQGKDDAGYSRLEVEEASEAESTSDNVIEMDDVDDKESDSL